MTWWNRAACKGMDLRLFFPDVGTFDKGREVCKTCPVVSECRAEADRIEPLEHGSFGVWGGESPKERLARRNLNTLKHKLPAGAPQVPAGSRVKPDLGITVNS